MPDSYTQTGPAVERAIPMWLIGDMNGDEITLRTLQRFTLTRNGHNETIFPHIENDNEILAYIQRNIKYGSIYALDEDDIMRAAGFTHYLTVHDPTATPDEDSQNVWVVTFG